MEFRVKSKYHVYSSLTIRHKGKRGDFITEKPIDLSSFSKDILFVVLSFVNILYIINHQFSTKEKIRLRHVCKNWKAIIEDSNKTFFSETFSLSLLCQWHSNLFNEQKSLKLEQGTNTILFDRYWPLFRRKFYNRTCVILIPTN